MFMQRTGNQRELLTPTLDGFCHLTESASFVA
jgi:hypothetical protein